MLSLPSQVLLRNQSHFEEGNWAFVNATEAEVFKRIDNPELVGLHQFYHHFSDCKKFAQQAQFFGPAFSLSELNLSAFDGVVIYMPKSKQQLSLLISNAAHIVKKNGAVLIVGENKAGVKSVAKMLEKIGPQVNKIDSAKHCALFAVTVPEPLQEFNIDDYAITRSYKINDEQIQIYSLPGVFGHKQLDPGTDLLLQQLTKQKLEFIKGEVYDFACGTGIIGCYLARALANKKRTSVTMTDVSALAIYCAQQSAKLNNIEANIVACDGVLTGSKAFDFIISNPPFHDGIKNDYSITENFIKRSYACSQAYGRLMLVANKFLPYADILDKVYNGFTELAGSTKYKIYEAVKRTRK